MLIFIVTTMLKTHVTSLANRSFENNETSSRRQAARERPNKLLSIFITKTAYQSGLPH